MIEVTLLGTGSPIPDPQRAGPSTRVRAGGQTFLVDCGRGVLQRAIAVGAGANSLTALLLTHLHSDHIADPVADHRDCVPAVAPGHEDEWRALAASAFDGRIELGPDLHRVEVRAPA